MSKPSDEFRKQFGCFVMYPQGCEKLVEAIEFLLRKQDALHERLEKLEKDKEVPSDFGKLVEPKRESMAEVFEKIDNSSPYANYDGQVQAAKDLVLKVIDEWAKTDSGLYELKKRIMEL